MIPLKLTIEGIYSYQERQIIDFENLTTAGLFGILGSVGSGKSSILEAVTYALYGETDRLNARDKRAYNMLNLKSDRAYIEFDFRNHENRTFRCVRELRRNSRNFEDVKVQQVVFYEFKNNAWQPLEHTDTEQIIGLSYNNFKRTIIIPQGQFKEFLELGAKDRTTMMKEIFQLHRFDLQDKVAALNSDNKSKLDQIEGRLIEFESINQEDIKNKKSELEALQTQLNTDKKKHELIDEKYQLLKILKEDYLKLQKQEAVFKDMQEKQPAFEEKQKQLETYERIFAKFDRLISDLKRASKQLKDVEIRRSKESESLIESTSVLQETKTLLDKISPYYNQLSEKRKEETDLELIAQILDFNAQIDVFKQRTLKGEAIVKEAAVTLEQTAMNIEKLESEIKSLTKQKYDSKLLLEIDGWYLQNAHHMKSVEECQRSLLERQEVLNKLLTEISEKKINIEDFESICNESLIRLRDKEKRANEQRTNFELQQKMTDYANALQNGVACPLCGSTSHPHIAGTEDVSFHLQMLADEMLKIKQEQEYWQNYRSIAQRMFDRREELQTQIHEAEKRLDTEKMLQNSHNLLFVWQDFDSEDKTDFEKKKQQSFNIEKQIKDKNAEIDKLRKSESKQRANLEKYNQELDKIKKDEHELSVKIKSNKLYLKILKFDDYRDSNLTDISDQLDALKKRNDEAEAMHHRLNTQITELDKLIAAKKSSLMGLDERIGQLKIELSDLNSTIEKQLAIEGFKHLKSIEDILANQVDTAQMRKEINDFKLQYAVLENQIHDLKIKLEHASYDDSKFAEQEELWNESKHKLSEKSNRTVALKVEMERLFKQYEEKLKLMKKQEELSRRAENLRILFNLFKAQGFVQYVSSIYLNQLCDHANLRFHRMTRNQLRLQLNENNDFEIIDYLNEGRTRSVKTLSGGQSFQVSLALALALAESVQSNAKAERNFFFIDEGFGTQDPESVNIVFETLLNLNKEKKIVGIISHVEELKERIPMILNITKDAERGSLIELQK